MSYHERRFMAFRANDQYYGHIHCIVSSNDLILRKNVHLETTNNVAKESFNFPCIKIIFFIFGVPKMSFFVKHMPKISCKIRAIYFLNYYTTFYVQIIKFLPLRSFPYTYFEKDKILPIQLKAGQI